MASSGSSSARRQERRSKRRASSRNSRRLWSADGLEVAVAGPIPRDRWNAMCFPRFWPAAAGLRERGSPSITTSIIGSRARSATAIPGSRLALVEAKGRQELRQLPAAADHQVDRLDRVRREPKCACRGAPGTARRDLARRLRRTALHRFPARGAFARSETIEAGRRRMEFRADAQFRHRQAGIENIRAVDTEQSNTTVLARHRLCRQAVSSAGAWHQSGNRGRPLPDRSRCRLPIRHLCWGRVELVEDDGRSAVCGRSSFHRESG